MVTDQRQRSRLSNIDPSMRIGIQSIDEEHDALFSQLNRLISDPFAVPESAAFSEILSRLGQQLSAHFDSEEAIMRACGMPANDVIEHIQAHNMILEQYGALNMALMQSETLHLPETILMIKGWVVEHLLSYDTKISRYAPAR